jgi:hypothetical protein
MGISHQRQRAGEGARWESRTSDMQEGSGCCDGGLEWGYCWSGGCCIMIRFIGGIRSGGLPME